MSGSSWLAVSATLSQSILAIKNAGAIGNRSSGTFWAGVVLCVGLPSGKCGGNVVADYLWWRFQSQDGRSAACRPSDHCDRQSFSGLRGFHGYARGDYRGNRRGFFRSNAASSVGEVPSLPKDERLGSIVWDQTLRPIVNLVEEVAVRRPPQISFTLLSSVEPPERVEFVSDKPSSNLQNKERARNCQTTTFSLSCSHGQARSPEAMFPPIREPWLRCISGPTGCPPSGLPRSLREAHVSSSTRRPTFGDGEYYFEQANIIRSVRDAKERYVMVELGGGNGPRAVDAALILGKLRPKFVPSWS